MKLTCTSLLLRGYSSPPEATAESPEILSQVEYTFYFSYISIHLVLEDFVAVVAAASDDIVPLQLSSF